MIMQLALHLALPSTWRLRNNVGAQAGGSGVVLTKVLPSLIGCIRGRRFRRDLSDLGQIMLSRTSLHETCSTGRKTIGVKTRHIGLYPLPLCP